MENEWAAAYSELSRQNAEARKAEMVKRGGVRRTVTETYYTPELWSVV
jgi:hypothetical protein